MPASSDVTEFAGALSQAGSALYLGRDGPQPRFASRQDHALVLGPPRCGKTSGVIIPSVAVHPGPVIVTSTRDDVLTAAWKARRAVAAEFGGEVVELSFGGVSPPASELSVRRWSCTDGCGEWNVALDRANILATTAMGRSEDPFWRDAASDLLAGCLFGAALLGEDDRTMARRIKSTDVSPYLQIISQQCPEDHDARFVFSGIYDENAMAEDTRRSVFATVSAQVLGQFRYETRPSSQTLDLDDFVRWWSTAFIVIPPERAPALRPLVTAFVLAATAAWRRQSSTDGTLLLALDEVANVAPLPTLPSIITSGAGDRIQCLLGMQEPGQASQWGSESSVITGGTTHLALFPGLRNRDYLTGISELLGNSIQYDFQIEVSRELPSGSRFATESTLIAERLELEQAMAVVPARARQFAARRTAATISARRMRLGIRCRVEDADGFVGGTLTEIMRYTSAKQQPRRRASVETDALANGEVGTMFVLTGAHGMKRQIVPWFLDAMWSNLIVGD